MKSAEFHERRKQLIRMMGPRSIAIVPAAPVQTRNRDVEYPYRQDSDFHYLSGFPEPEAVAVLLPGNPHGEFILFCRERDEDMELWTGTRAGQEGAKRDYGADDSFPISDLDEILPGMLEKAERVYFTLGTYAEFDQKLIDWVNRLRSKVRSGVTTPLEIVALDHFLHDMRLYKSPAEAQAMRRAAEISMAAHRRAMQVCRPGLYEYQIEAELLHTFMTMGARYPAYSSIVGGGKNACILHYVENSEPLREGDLLLIDAGAEFDHYASDITRTFPVSGHFTKPQRALYEVVLAAQRAAIKQVKPGNHWNDPHEAAVRLLTKGLVELGLLKGSVSKLIKKEEYKRFFMHRTGHWLGIDVHDVGDYKVSDVWRVLEPGMVLTVEPGVYIAPHSKGVDKEWWGIGIRIEDDVLVTEDGNEVLTAELPKTVEAIEGLMAGRPI